MFKGIVTLLNAERGEFVKKEGGEKIVFFKGSVLTLDGNVLPISMNVEVYDSIKTLTAQSILGDVEIGLKNSSFNGKQTLKMYLLSFVPQN